MLVGSVVELLDLVAFKCDDLNGPILMLDVKDLGGDGGDDAKVVAGPLDGAPQLGAGVCGIKSTVGKYDVHRLELVSNKPVAALKPAVATTQAGAEVADTFARTSD